MGQLSELAVSVKPSKNFSDIKSSYNNTYWSVLSTFNWSFLHWTFICWHYSQSNNSLMLNWLLKWVWHKFWTTIGHSYLVQQLKYCWALECFQSVVSTLYLQQRLPPQMQPWTPWRSALCSHPSHNVHVHPVLGGIHLGHLKVKGQKYGMIGVSAPPPPILHWWGYAGLGSNLGERGEVLDESS